MTLEEHAEAIRAAIKAAMADGHRLTDFDNMPIQQMDLNHALYDMEGSDGYGKYFDVMYDGGVDQ